MKVLGVVERSLQSMGMMTSLMNERSLLGGSGARNILTLRSGYSDRNLCSFLRKEFSLMMNANVLRSLLLLPTWTITLEPMMKTDQSSKRRMKKSNSMVSIVSRLISCQLPKQYDQEKALL